VVGYPVNLGVVTTGAAAGGGVAQVSGSANVNGKFWPTPVSMGPAAATAAVVLTVKTLKVGESPATTPTPPEATPSWRVRCC
jgi:hypothetical protein